MSDRRPAQTTSEYLEELFEARRRGDPIADQIADPRGVAVVEQPDADHEPEPDPDPLTVADHLKQIRNQEDTR